MRRRNRAGSSHRASRFSLSRRVDPDAPRKPPPLIRAAHKGRSTPLAPAPLGPLPPSCAPSRTCRGARVRRRPRYAPRRNHLAQALAQRLQRLSEEFLSSRAPQQSGARSPRLLTSQRSSDDLGTAQGPGAALLSPHRGREAALFRQGIWLRRGQDASQVHHRCRIRRPVQACAYLRRTRARV
ncbi:hypothetical protein EXIGLDRAFT_423797 [Exidia glandulosa HHB12029]|uniref:Uncharacterized protein n=1 Tax=Exidia glandulosa HHB12029 TaxID=1314781 RepID=A0A165KJW8_EXIGL|nr:hypothetical protein EXIGLDRAFT_423797 [Exidia glandulosa HHB12029]